MLMIDFKSYLTEYKRDFYACYKYRCFAFKIG